MRPDRRVTTDGREVLVVRRIAILGGAGLATLGFVLALVSLARPWASYRVWTDASGGTEGVELTGDLAVFQLDRGIWYVVILLAVLGLLFGAVASVGRTARAYGVAALVLAVVGMLLTASLTNNLAAAAVSELASLVGTVQVQTRASSGAGHATVALPLLGLGAALLSVRTPAG
jgi:hypothetical protein